MSVHGPLLLVERDVVEALELEAARRTNNPADVIVRIAELRPDDLLPADR